MDSSHGSHTEWTEALTRAFDGCDGGEHALFVETRTDFTVSGRSGEALETRLTHLTGMAARGPEGTSFISDPGPEDARSLLRTSPKDARSLRRGGDPACVVAPDVDAALADSRKLVERLVSADTRCPTGLGIEARCVGFVQQIWVGRVGSQVRTDRRAGTSLRVEASRAVGDRRVVRAVLEYAHARSELPPPEWSTEAHEGLRERVEQRLDVRRAPAGVRPAVFAPGVGGILVHELVGHALEADIVLSGRSWLASRGALAGCKALHVIDDPRRGRAAWRVDDEGFDAGATSLLREGRVTHWIHDTHTAAVSGHAPNGHGRAASYRDTVLPRLGATFVAAGSEDPAEVSSRFGQAVYVRRMETGHVDPATGVASFRVTDADLIHDGRTGPALAPFLLRVAGPDLARGGVHIGDDLAFDTCIGMCHREGQPLSTTVGAPTMCIGMTTVIA